MPSLPLNDEAIYRHQLIRMQELTDTFKGEIWMSNFTIRVELHGANGADYILLHEKMAQQGLTDIVVDDSGRRYKMSPGEYNFQGIATIEQVMTSARVATSQTNRNWAIMVSEASKRIWEGLPFA
ncbi:hypothetical protein O3299_15620 [Janthinobacterium sp. SUN176]|uniref:hypothetical protein n=1 Tax=Janthinobacterium sp. SUN176 TaxID=3014788 RepID=UPI002713443E|nr:hypothetical protein [Janthinobacterium sp. SUN176]MDO8072960.1 hypothetical protein [Janthinobacterium sp. SUN176]